MFSVACFRRPGSNLLLRVVALGNLADSVMKDAPNSAKIRFQGWTNHEHAETQRPKLSDPARGTHGLQPERDGRDRWSKRSFMWEESRACVHGPPQTPSSREYPLR